VQTCATSPMGSRWARPASVASSETAENVQPNQASAPEEETFQVTLLSINGEQHVVFVSESQSVHDLQKLAASELNWNHPWTLSFAHGCTAIECNQREKSLGAMGLVEDCELMVLKRDPWRISTVGQSCYNSEYLCKVIELREVGPHALELDFSAFGDNSLGPLQKAERSVLIWECPNPRSLRDPIEDVTFFAGEPHRFKKARSRVHFTVDSDTHKEGTMTFTDVPTRGKVSFIFGESGYSKLDIDIGPEVMT